jgi:hypothetical protein
MDRNQAQSYWQAPHNLYEVSASASGKLTSAQRGWWRRSNQCKHRQVELILYGSVMTWKSAIGTTFARSYHITRHSGRCMYIPCAFLVLSGLWSAETLLARHDSRNQCFRESTELPQKGETIRLAFSDWDSPKACLRSQRSFDSFISARI